MNQDCKTCIDLELVLGYVETGYNSILRQFVVRRKIEFMHLWPALVLQCKVRLYDANNVDLKKLKSHAKNAIKSNKVILTLQCTLINLQPL